MKDPAWMRDKLHALAIEADEMLGSCDASDILDTLEEARNAMTQGAETIARLMAELEQAKRERDAAVADITGAEPCFACKHFKRNGGTCGGGKRCLEKMIQAKAEGRKYKGLYWEWRGVQEVAEDE